MDATLSADLGFLYAAARVAEFLNPALGRGSVAAIAGDIRAAMLDEVDFTKEAAHVAEFASYLRATGMEVGRTCPVVYGEASSKGVLTMSRLRGVPLTDIEAIRSITDVEPEAVLVGALTPGSARCLPRGASTPTCIRETSWRCPTAASASSTSGSSGSVAPSTWAAVRALVASTASGDYDTMARALAAMGAFGRGEAAWLGARGRGGRRAWDGAGARASGSDPREPSDDGELDYAAFAADLEAVFKDAAAAAAATTVTVLPADDGDRDAAQASAAAASAAAAAVTFDEAAVNRLLLSVVRVGRDLRHPLPARVRDPAQAAALLRPVHPGPCSGAQPGGRLEGRARLDGVAVWRKRCGRDLIDFFFLSLFSSLLLLVLHRAFFLIVSLCTRTWRDSRFQKRSRREARRKRRGLKGLSYIFLISEKKRQQEKLTQSSSSISFPPTGPLGLGLGGLSTAPPRRADTSDQIGHPCRWRLSSRPCSPRPVVACSS